MDSENIEDSPPPEDLCSLAPRCSETLKKSTSVEGIQKYRAENYKKDKSYDQAQKDVNFEIEYLAGKSNCCEVNYQTSDKLDEKYDANEKNTSSSNFISENVLNQAKLRSYTTKDANSKNKLILKKKNQFKEEISDNEKSSNKNISVTKLKINITENTVLEKQLTETKKTYVKTVELSHTPHFNPNGEISSFHRIDCPICEKACFYINIRSHMRAHFDYYPYRCGYCPILGADESSIQKHCVNIHSDRILKISSNSVSKTKVEKYKAKLLEVSNLITSSYSVNLCEDDNIDESLKHSLRNDYKHPEIELSENTIIQKYSLRIKMNNIAHQILFQKMPSEISLSLAFAGNHDVSNSPKPYMCGFCKFVGDSIFVIQKHLEKQHNLKSKCLEKKKITKVSKICEPFSVSPINTSRTCKVCKRQMPLSKFLSHVQLHYDLRKPYFHCCNCLFRCKENVTIIFHLKQFHPGNSTIVLFTPLDGGELEPIEVHKLSEISFKKPCLICNKEIMTKFMQHHLMSVHGLKGLYKCIYCSYKATARDIVARHVTINHRDLISPPNPKAFDLENKKKKHLMSQTISFKKLKTDVVSTSMANYQFLLSNSDSNPGTGAQTEISFAAPSNIENATFNYAIKSEVIEQGQTFSESQLSTFQNINDPFESLPGPVDCNFGMQGFNDILMSQMTEAILYNQAVVQIENFDSKDLIFIGPDICALCGKMMFKNNVHYHMRSHFRKPMFLCNHCNYRQRSRHSVYLHQATTHNDRSNVGEIEFGDIKKLEDNLDKYTRWYFAQCLQIKGNVNDSVLSSANNIICQPKSKSRDKPITNSKPNFTVYLRKYSSYFLCSLCNEKIPNMDTFKFHKYKHTEIIIRYYCLKCPFSTRLKNTAEIHVKTHKNVTHFKKRVTVKYLNYLTCGMYSFLTVSVPQLKQKQNASIIPYIMLQDCCKTL